jgi:hypothetical protein
MQIPRGGTGRLRGRPRLHSARSGSYTMRA